MRREYQYLAGPASLFHRAPGGDGKPKHHVVSGTWSDVLPSQAAAIRSLVFT